MLKQLRQDIVTLKPDKGNGIVPVNTNEYNLAMKNLHSKKKKNKVIKEGLYKFKVINTVKNCTKLC